MPDKSEPMKAEHIFKKIVWRGALDLAAPIEHATTWSITGIAALVALLISNLGEVMKVAETSGLRWGIVLFTISILSGALSKHIGMGVSNGLELVKKIETTILSEQGIAVVQAMKTPLPQVMEEIAEAFKWPLSIFMRRSALAGLRDPLCSDKRLIRSFCNQTFFLYLHWIAAAAGLLTIAFSIVTSPPGAGLGCP